MILIPVILIALACYIFYSTSRRAVYRRTPLNRWFMSRPGLSRLLTAVLTAVAFTLAVRYQGLAVGVLLGLAAVMTTYGCIVLIHPLTGRPDA